MRLTRRVLMAAVLSLAMATSSSFAAQDAAKVAVVDFAKIFQQMPETKQAQTTMQTAAAPVQKEIGRLNQEYQKAVASYKSAKPATKDQKEKDLNLKAQALQKYQQEQGALMQKKEQELIAPIQDKIKGAISSIAQKEGFSLVLDKSVQVWGTPDHDLTFKVMDQLNIK
ncbi:MAG: OmpH family outer membrane protein [Chlorobiaceae bacterium]